jgi:hypothetical protein
MLVPYFYFKIGDAIEIMQLHNTKIKFRTEEVNVDGTTIYIKSVEEPEFDCAVLYCNGSTISKSYRFIQVVGWGERYCAALEILNQRTN